MNGYIIIALVAGAFIGGLLFGYHYRVLVDDGVNLVVAKEQVKKAQTGETNIIKFNQDFKKDTQHVKDNCVSRPLPADIKRLLR